ncbi:LOW QUALITY PROTEIN: photosystem I P700 chlorophyll a apoprotein A2-like [Juglans microcarpa x Juglans regia]|uniref:LOW QUALITY PROTEIN: photosystem I P700 chlorophyll a apoprotein A2-like n=1 Tax=Juglans microcarpa x Juglans regia TaxID=2249226 RepID=UPI001B7DDCCD|nr:LOW QUALITY PROTEIN: photosystem I P700 chlorophyll a apoprotein A2-like [Juglans microcarpa x Juglans regia]
MEKTELVSPHEYHVQQPKTQNPPTKLKGSEPVKIKYISSPLLVKASNATEFRAIVQELTGKNSEDTFGFFNSSSTNYAVTDHLGNPQQNNAWLSQPAVEAFTREGALGPVNIAYFGVYQWWYTIGLWTNGDLYTGALFLLFLSIISLIAGWLHLQPKWKPSVSWFKNAESRLNHHLSGLFGVSSLAWKGHLVHVAIPESEREYVQWNNFLEVLPHPQGLGPLFTGQRNLYAQNPDSGSHLFGTSQGAGTVVLTLLGGFHPTNAKLWLTDIAHHHLAIAFIFLVAGHMYRTNFGIGIVY